MVDNGSIGKDKLSSLIYATPQVNNPTIISQQISDNTLATRQLSRPTSVLGKTGFRINSSNQLKHRSDICY